MEASDILELGVINAERGKKLLPLMLEEEYLERKRKDSDITRKRTRITEGRCCCHFNNRRALRCIQIFDMVTLPITPVRGAFAILAFMRKTSYLALNHYTNTRFITFWF